MKIKSTFAKSRKPLKEQVVIFVSKNRLLILFSFLFLIGIFLGSLFVKNAEDSTISSLKFITGSFLKQRTGQTFLQILNSSFYSSFIFILVAFLCSYYPLAVVIFPFIPIFRGMGLGMASGYFYFTYGLKGVLYCMAIIFPPAIVSFIAIIIATTRGFKLSASFAAVMVNKSDAISLPHTQLRINFYTFILCLVIVLVSALLDASLTMVLFRFFNFS